MVLPMGEEEVGLQVEAGGGQPEVVEVGQVSWLELGVEAELEEEQASKEERKTLPRCRKKQERKARYQRGTSSVSTQKSLDSDWNE